MKTIQMLTICCSLFIALSAGAQKQTISKQLKAADCEFIIHYKGKPVKVLDQKITLRAVADREEHIARDASRQISAMGYRSYHLEFAYTGHYHIDVPYAIRTIEFLNDKRKVIHTISITRPARSQSESERDKKLAVRYLAINLEGIPLVLLDDVAVIDFKQ